MATTTENAELYQRDYYEWTQTTAAAIRVGHLSALSRPALAEEIEDLGKSEFREVETGLEILLTHLIRWNHQQEFRSRSWLITIVGQQKQLTRRFAHSPSLRGRLDDAFEHVYRDAVDLAALETGLPEDAFPSTSPWDLDGCLDPGVIPSSERASV